jgi:oligosaccharyltransferase complex subunit delta (ribophorin II)
LSQELQFDHDSNVHYLDIGPLKIDVGKYSLVFEVIAHCTILLFFMMY